MKPDVLELDEIALFAGVPRPVLEALVPELEALELAAGERLCTQGEVGRELWIVLRGELEASRAGPGGRRERGALLGPGDWFGEMALLDLQGQPFTVRTLAPSRVVRLRASTLDGLYRRDLKSYALIWMNAARELSRRLRRNLDAPPRRRRTPASPARGLPS
ncbi:MAG: cyclic nucleotide-binding domain-containing protein [Polyangiaceae bacterium]|nr:cyclic nucleotide-binding domain-containing protein [Polyangiaceae bacterium]